MEPVEAAYKQIYRLSLKRTVVAQEVKRVVQQLDGRWLESSALLAACRSVLELNPKLLLMSKLSAPAINV